MWGGIYIVHVNFLLSLAGTKNLMENVGYITKHLERTDCVSKVSKCVILLAILITFSISETFAETTKNLTEDVKLHPIGWLTENIKFKAGTVVKLNDYGEVIEGTLASGNELMPVGWRRVIRSFNTNQGWGDYGHGTENPGHLRFKGNTIVSFNSRGEVVSGTLEYDAFILLHPDRPGIVRFKCDEVIKYYDNGLVAEGAIRDDTLFKPSGWTRMVGNGEAGYVKFKGGTLLKFNNSGEIIEGTIKGDTPIWLEDGTKKVYPAGSIVKFVDDKTTVN